MNKSFFLTQILELLKCNECKNDTNCDHCKGTGLRFPNQQKINKVIENLNDKEMEEWANCGICLPN